MSLLSLIAALAVMSKGQVEKTEIPTDAASFLQYLETSYTPLQCIEFEFESSLTKAGEQIPFQSYKGSYRYVQGLGERANYVSREGVNGRVQQSVQVASLRDIETLRAKLDEARPADCQVSSALKAFFLTDPGMPGRILLIRTLLGCEDKIRSSFTHQGVEDVDGHRLTKVGFDSPKRQRLFWIDPSRGGHPLRWETQRDGKVVFRVSDIQLAQFKGRDDKQVWLPVLGRVIHFVGLTEEKPPQPIFSSTPTQFEEIRVLVPTVRVNHGLDEQAIAVRFEKGDYVTDETKRTTFRFDPKRSQPLTNLSAEQATDLLEDGIREADGQLAGLTASGKSSFFSLSTTLAGVIAVGSLSALFFAWRIKKRLS